MVDQPVKPEYLAILNQVFLLNQKIEKLSEKNSLSRHIERIKEQFEQLGLKSEDPIGQKFDETRTDCDASIAGESTDNLIIVEVLKPTIRQTDSYASRIVQRACVIVRSADHN